MEKMEKKEKTEKTAKVKKSGSVLERLANLPVIRFFENSRNAGLLVVKIIILLLITYAWIWVCGLVFDKWLQLFGAVRIGSATISTATLITLIVLILALIINLFLSVLAVIRFVKGKGRTAAKAKAEA